MNSPEHLLTTLNHQEHDPALTDLDSRRTPIHNIQADAPPPNIIARGEALQEYGVY